VNIGQNVGYTDAGHPFFLLSLLGGHKQTLALKFFQISGLQNLVFLISKKKLWSAKLSALQIF
jgi:hypothetical protein